MTIAAATIRRTDAVPLRMGATPVETRPDGSKVYEGIAAFGDVVAPYPDLVPPRSEFRPADEVMSPAALASLEGLRFTGGLRRRDWDGKVTLPGDHTPELDDPDGLAIEGAVLKGWREDMPGEPPALRVRVIAHTRAMQTLLEGGTRGLSLGYVAEEDKTPGVHNGKPYQVVQRRHRYYHLAAVGDPRSKTPSGRGARLDAAPRPARTSLLPSPREGKQPPMKLSRLAILALATLAGKDAPADASPAAADANPDGTRTDIGVRPVTPAVTLPPADAELLKQMTPEVQAAIVAAMGGAAALETAATDPAMPGMEGDANDAAEVAADLGQDAAGMAPVLAELAAIKAMLAAAGLTPAATSTDALPAGDASGGAAMLDAAATPPALLDSAPRKDNATVTIAAITKSLTFDPALVIANAEKAAAAAGRTAASAQYAADATFVGVVRKDGHPADTVQDAATVMLGTIKRHLPTLAPVAEEHIKGQRLDSLVPLYQAAEAVRRKDLMTDQQNSLRALFDHMPADTLTPLPGNETPGDGIVRAPMRTAS